MVANRGPELVAVCSTFVSLAVTSVLLRLYVRLRLVRAFGWDDVFMVTALAFQIMFTLSAINGVHWGTGRHMSDLNEEQITKALKWWYLCYPAYCLAMVFAKISVGLFLLRVTIQPLYRRIIYINMTATVITGLVFFFISVLQCSPVSFFWNKFHGTGTCVNIDAIIGIAFAYSAVASVCDFTFGLLPIFLVWNLNMAKNQKLMLIPILSMACIASIAVTVRMGFLMKFKSPDFLWDTLDVAIWSDIEQGLAITAGSLATLRPLYRDITRRLGWSEAATNTFPSGDHKDPRRWYRTPSIDQRKRSGPFSLVTITRAENDTRRSESSEENLAGRVPKPGPVRLRNDLVEESEQSKGFNSWRIQVGDRSDEELTATHGITKQTDVFLESNNQHLMR
ncbi:hypothetical protein BU23DRAFT_487509 [Bimuria novae-zelandiae CBS 107.79]|uniref:Rhodopsin domain-containing protein n=1 Tax=Bimuria novae-zelandiae CBS 107.79 TaxID=1447943 RepID=A0A6A5UML0_9PLEO|nr:hypothetical protein BU23DRAFT_487509 [Bimuria novae-zelandiae CBS 107.79]